MGHGMVYSWGEMGSDARMFPRVVVVSVLRRERPRGLDWQQVVVVPCGYRGGGVDVGKVKVELEVERTIHETWDALVEC